MLIYRSGDSVQKARKVGGFYGAILGLVLAATFTSLAPGLWFVALALVPIGLIIGATVMGVDATRLQRPPLGQQPAPEDNQ